MGTKLTKDLGGRPTKLTEEVITKLESIFQVGGTIDEATSYAGISKMTYYRWLESDEGFVTKMEAAQHYADVVAKNVVVDSIVKGRDLQTAKWWLEKRQFNIPATQLNIAGKEINFQIVRGDDSNAVQVGETEALPLEE